MTIRTENAGGRVLEHAAYSAAIESCHVSTGALHGSISLNISGGRAVISAGKSCGIYAELETENQAPVRLCPPESKPPQGG